MARLARSLQQVLVKSMNVALPQLKKHLLKNHLNGPLGPSSVRQRSGKLRKSVQITKATAGVSDTGSSAAVATLKINAPYAKIHIGNKPHKTTIRAKPGKKMAIPTKFAVRGKRGRPIAGPNDPRWGKTFIRNNTIYGRTGKTARSIKPLFNLRDSVVVPVRVDIQQDIVQVGQRFFLQEVQQRLKKALNQ